MLFKILILSILTSVGGFFMNSPFSWDFGEKSTEKIPVNLLETSTTSIESMDEIYRISQCTYDYKGLRLNKGCLGESEEPLICTQGELVLKTFDDGSEMCCCNFSKLDKNKIMTN
jgi:hypothetical protein